MKIHINDETKWRATAVLYGFHVKKIGHRDYVALNNKKHIVGKTTLTYNPFTDTALRRGYLYVANKSK